MDLQDSKNLPVPPLPAAAEARLELASKAAHSDSPDECSLHELQVHQIELEMQNEQLRQARVALEESRDRYFDLYEFAPVGYLALTDIGLIADINLTGATLLGETRGKLINRRFDLFVAVEDRERCRRFFASEACAPDRQNCELAIVRPDGSSIYLRLDCQISTRVGEASQLRITLTDMTERKKLEAAREESLSRLQKIASRVPGVVFEFRMRADGSSCIPYASEAIREIYRVSPEEVRDDTSPVFAVVHPDDLAEHLASIQASAKDLTPWRQEYRLKFADEPDIWLLGNSLPQREADGSVLWHGFITDITEKRLAEQQQRIAAIAFECQEGMLVADADTVILRINGCFTEITGYTAEEVVSRKTDLLKSGRHDASFYAAMWDSLRRSGSWQGEIWNRRKNGEVYPEWLTISAVKGSTGEVTHYVASMTDITLRKTAENEIRNLAYFDPLTGLPNRRLILDRLQQSLASSERYGRQGALMLLDLDNFKILNDTLGHDVGDQLLVDVALRLKSCVREGDTVARLGGDEFVVILEDLDQTGLAAMQAESVARKILIRVSEPYLLDVALAGATPSKRNHHCTSSIGITLFCGKPVTTDVLLKQADTAMYQAKAAGRNTLRFFDLDMQVEVTARAALEADLREAVLQEQFVLYYQAQVTAEGRPTGTEALVRWRHPQRGILVPAEFIPAAEESGLILPLDLWVLESACRQLARWSTRPEMAHLTVAVNVSARQFCQANFVDQVQAALERSGANPRQLKIEVTESLLIEDIEGAISKMSSLTAEGVRFSLDDFGAGYSSLAHLRRLPLDQLKIGQGFVRDILVDQNDAAIARMVLALARSLGLEVIAEGVATEAQLDFLVREGCCAYQGYLFSRPLPLDDFETLVRRVADG